MKKLLKNDIIVIVSGCSAQAAAKAGLMDPDAAEYCGAGPETRVQAGWYPACPAHGLLRGYLPYDDPGFRYCKGLGHQHFSGSVWAALPNGCPRRPSPSATTSWRPASRPFLGVDPYTKGSRESPRCFRASMASRTGSRPSSSETTEGRRGGRGVEGGPARPPRPASKEPASPEQKAI